MSSRLDEGPIDQDGQYAEQASGRYRAMSTMAVASLVFGLLSVLTVWNWYLGLIPAVGILLGYLALRRIRKAPKELTGLGLAWAGVWLSVAFGVLGYGVLTFARAKDFPHGYQRISYEMLQPDPDVPRQLIPDKAFDLRGKKVGVKGYMYPGRQPTGLKRFLICPALTNCPFCVPNPRPTEMIRVTLEGDLKADYTTHLIRVGGRFRVDLEAPGGVPYHIEADYLKQPR